MPAHGDRMPAAVTESAREARKAFYCDLCQKGYGRINEFEAHESSYDHLHKKRLKEMKQLSKDPNSRARAAKAEAKDSPISIKAPISLASGAKKGGFKKGGFKSAFAPVEDEGVKPTADVVMEDAGASQMKQVEREADESDWEGDDIYDPERPTGCHPGCEGWGG